MKSKPATPEVYGAIVGVDWGNGRHALSLQVGQGEVESSFLPASPEQIDHWVRQLEARTPGQPLAIVLEMGNGALIEQLHSYDFIDIYALPCATTSHLRKAFKPSRAKDDLPDSKLHLEILRRHWDQLRLLCPPSGLDKRLGLLNQQRRLLCEDSTTLTNKLRDCLKTYYPVALELTGVLDSKMALRFLEKWPTLAQLKRARPETLRQFYRQSGSRNASLIEQRLEKIAQARAVSIDEALLAAMSAYMAALIAQIKVVTEQIAKFDQLIAEAYAQHPDRAIWSSFPGAGEGLAPRLAAAWGTDRERYQSAHEMALYSGVAPVTERSGKAKAWVHRRWARPRFLHQSFWEYANQSSLRCRWAKAYVEEQMARGKSRSTALRALAFKWQRIMFACWRHHEPYDDAKYESSLAQRGSLLALGA